MVHLSYPSSGNTHRQPFGVQGEEPLDCRSETGAICCASENSVHSIVHKVTQGRLCTNDGKSGGRGLKSSI